MDNEILKEFLVSAMIMMLFFSFVVEEISLGKIQWKMRESERKFEFEIFKEKSKVYVKSEERKRVLIWND